MLFYIQGWETSGTIDDNSILPVNVKLKELR